MKNGEKEVNLLNLFAYVALIIFAVLQVLSVFAHFNILKIEGVLINILDTVKNICVCIVIGVTAFKFIKGKSKGVIWSYWISLALFIICSILILI